MNAFQQALSGALLTCSCACALAQVGISQEHPLTGGAASPMARSGAVRLMNEPSSTTGSIIRRDLKWSSLIPLNKPYGQFAPEEKAELHALYEALQPGDEPPFPAEGLKPVFNSIRKGQEIVRARGRLNLIVTVGPDGKAIDVKDVGGVKGVNALEMTQFAGSVLLMTKFKPAVCGGKPCQSQFPFTLDLQMR